MKDMKMQMAFIDRKGEIEELRNYLCTPANSILFLHGPKSSGKTTLMYRLFEQITQENAYEINFLNLREVFLTSYDDFIDAFFKSTEQGNGIKTGTRRQYSLFGLFKLDAFTERMLRQKREDPFLVMKREFQRLQKKNIQPVIIIDEFHKLDGLYMPDKQKRLMVELMNFFVAMTKESHLCHVIIASSDGFLLKQIYTTSRLYLSSRFMKLDYLEKEDVFTWLSDVGKYNKVKEYSLDQGQIELIWDTVGGSAWEIYSILEQLFQRPLDEIVNMIKREKTAMIADWCFRDPSGAREKVLEPYRATNLLGIRSFIPAQLDVLGQAVKDNILYYDPIEGVYGIQGKSLEWGIKGYFEE